MDINLSKLWEIVKDRGAWHAAVHGVTELDLVSEKQQNNSKTRLNMWGENDVFLRNSLELG